MANAYTNIIEFYNQWYNVLSSFYLTHYRNMFSIYLQYVNTYKI